MRVAIVGGGPGGAQCARRLAESGGTVSLFEARPTFEKACGGGIPARGVRRFPFLAGAGLAPKAIRRCLLIDPDGREAEVPIPDPLHIYRRAELHALMLERAAAAGAVVRRERVVAVERDAGSGGGWRLRSSSGDVRGPFDFLVAADGAAGVVRRILAGSAPAGALTQGIGYYLPDLSEEFVTLRFFRGLNGYLWVFPRPDHSSAGICSGLGERPAAALRHLLDGFLRERYGEAVVRRAAPYAALIPGAPADPGAAPLLGAGWAVVGDAARAVDPLTREGIYYAMLSGDLLGECLAAGDPGRYGPAWRRLVAAEFAWAARHANGFFEARFVGRLVALSRRSPAVGRVLGDLIAGRQSYRGLKGRLLRTLPALALDCLRAAAPLRLRRDS